MIHLRGAPFTSYAPPFLSMQATAAVLQTVKTKLAAEAHTAASHASDLANAVADGHIEVTVDGKRTAST